MGGLIDKWREEIATTPEKRQTEAAGDNYTQTPLNVTCKPAYEATEENYYPRLAAEAREKEQQREAAEKHLEAAQGYQEAIRRAGWLRAEIRKGLKNGTPPEKLFLLAAEAIGLMTGDPSFYAECEKGARDIIAKFSTP